jgi:hypothetical protein
MHRPTRSREEEARLRNGGPPPSYRPSRQRDELNIFADPVDPARTRESGRRTRRNSDSSVADVRSGKILSPDDERRRAERRHRERRERDGKTREGKTSQSSPKAKKPNHRLDLIDKLDVTSIYGTGRKYHDALTSLSVEHPLTLACHSIPSRRAF